MTLTIEVDDDKAVDLLKHLKELNITKLKTTDEVRTNNLPGAELPAGQNEPYSTKEQAELMALSGSLKMSPERFKEYEAFLQEIRNEWE